MTDDVKQKARELATKLREMRALCDAECEGRCNFCPQEVANETADFLDKFDQALTEAVAAERERVADIAIDYRPGDLLAMAIAATIRKGPLP